MPIKDTPIEIEEEVTTVADTPVPDVQLGGESTPELDRFKALKAAFLDNYNTGAPVAESYQKYIGEFDKDSTLTRLAQEKAVVDNQAVSTVVEQSLIEDPEVFTEIAPAAIEAQEENVIKASDPSYQFVDAISSPMTEEETKKVVATNVKLWEMLNKASANIDNSDYLMDFGTSLVPFVDTLTEALTLGSVFNNEDVVEQMVLTFKSLPVEEQEELYPGLITEIIDGLGPLRGVDTLKKFLDPRGEDDLGDFSNWWKVIDAVDLASVGATAAILLTRSSKSLNMPKIMKQAENPEAAGDATAVALVDEDAAGAMNMTQETAFGDAVAFDTSIEDIGHTPGISTETLKSLEKFFGDADKTIEDIMLGNGYLKEGILNTVERAAAEKVAMAKLRKAQHENIRVVDKTENTTTFAYKEKLEDGTLSDTEYTLDLTLNDVGQWNQSQMGVLSEWLASPTVFAKDLARMDVDAAQRLDSQTAKVFRQLSGLQRQAVEPLGNLLRPKNKRRLEGVEKALRDGDEFLNDNGTRGKVFDVDELVGQYGFDQGQISAYYRTNRLYNNLWRLRNNTKREEMIAFGFKKTKLVNDEYSFGKPFESGAKAAEALRQGSISQVYDTVDGSVIKNVSLDSLDEQYALGKTLVRLEEPWAAPGAGKVKHVLVNSTDVEELPAVVLSRKEGYVPRVMEDGYWFVKEFEDSIVDGKAIGMTPVKTLRYFDNKAEAIKYRDKIRQEAVDKEGLTPKQAEEKFKELEDREQEIISTATGNFSHGSGGLYTGARAEDEVLFGFNGEAGQRINPYEALVRNISNVSRQVPINQWRLGLEQRWLNTARQLGVKAEKFGELPSNIESTRAGTFLNKMAKQIRDWQGFPTKEEQVYNAVNQRMYEWALKYDMPRAAKMIGWARDKDPIAASRAAAFHSLLGWFNPAQLWVQAQGMSIAVSLNLGKNLTKTLQQTSALTWIGPNASHPSQFKRAAKVFGQDPEELKAIHDLWKKTGLEDSILQTADHSAGLRGHGIAMDALSRAADKGLFFYRHGEFLNRRMAFTTALDEFRTGSKGRFPTDDELKGVLDRTNNLMLNLSKANRAQFQKGITSLPTQFFQVSAKALETVTGANDNLTGAERMRVLAGQVALYGFAGIPLANVGANYLMEVAGVTQEDIDNNPDLVKTWNDGFWGVMTGPIMGLDVEVSSRGSLIRGVSDFIDNWAYSESTVGEKLLGAFGSTGTRFWDSFTKQIRKVSIHGVPSDAIDLVKIPTLPFLDSISTWRNAEKAVFMQLIDKILDKNEDPAVQRGFEIRESIAAAIGFRLSDELQAHELNERTQHMKDTRRKYADMIVDIINEVVIRDNAGILTEEYEQQAEQMKGMIYNSLDFDERLEISEMVRNRLLRDDKQANAINRYKRTFAADIADGVVTWKNAVTGTTVQTVNPPEEDK